MGKSKKRRSTSSKPSKPVNDMDNNADLKFSDSDDEAEEKMLLDEVFDRKKSNTFHNETEQSIYGIDNSSDDESDGAEENELDSNIDDDSEQEADDSEDDQDLKDELADSDIEGMEEDDLPNMKAWGKNKRLYYNTDYVDDDHGGFQAEEDEVAADVEETEAMAIQKRLVAEMDNTEDVFEFLVQKPKEQTDKSLDQQHIVSKDLSEMSNKEKLQLLEKESPELLGLVNDFKELMKDVRLHLLPIVQLLNQGKIPACTAGDSVRLRMELILNYCTNIAFYLLLKLKRTPVNQHPVIHRLVATKQLILKQEDLYQDQLLPQIELILTTENLELLIDPVVKKTTKSKELTNDKKANKEIKKKSKNIEKDTIKNTQPDDSLKKRAITYQIAKNKGLTAQVKKELQNPRVKHKLKFRKAKIRRKGQIREPRTELDRYGGELSGIKASVRKSIPIK